MRGVMDDFAIFKTALRPIQIGQLHSGSNPLSILPILAPVADDAIFAVSEIASTGTVVGTVVATDPGDTLSYAITVGNTGTVFAIDNAGNITTLQNLDYETTTQYVFTVEVTDV